MQRNLHSLTRRSLHPALMFQFVIRTYHCIWGYCQITCELTYRWQTITGEQWPRGDKGTYLCTNLLKRWHGTLMICSQEEGVHLFILPTLLLKARPPMPP